MAPHTTDNGCDVARHGGGYAGIIEFVFGGKWVKPPPRLPPAIQCQQNSDKYKINKTGLLRSTKYAYERTHIHINMTHFTRFL